MSPSGLGERPPRTLAVIPARGGSKGIPRKNLCPIGGKPLIAWAIEAARQAGLDQVVVTTDDPAIGQTASRFGAHIVWRGAELSGDAVTLDPVVFDAVAQEERAGRHYDLVLTIQATSPLLRTSTIRRIVERFRDPTVDTILTAKDDTHLAWTVRDDTPRPAYQRRVNRQQLPIRLRETGGVLATRRPFVTPESRIGARVMLEVLDGFEGVDIDTADHWLTAEAALSRRRIAFVVIGNERHGLGHVSRTLTLLECLNGHVTRVFCLPGQELAQRILEQAWYDVRRVERQSLLEELVNFGAQIVVHDELETDPEHIKAEQNAGMRVVLFEDLGPSQAHADLVFNALYPADRTEPARARWFGPAVYCMRSEFRLAQPRAWSPSVERILITFGGTDPSGLTFKALRVVVQACQVPITVVAGIGFGRRQELELEIERLQAIGRSVELLTNVQLMSEVMRRADLAFTSAGRTLYELAHIGVPAIVMAQNDTEMQHRFASLENGFLFLGRGCDVENDAIASALHALLGSAELRAAMRERMRSVDLTGGRDFVIKQILEMGHVASPRS